MPFAFTETLDVCDLCKSKNLIHRALGAKVMECAECGYRFANPRPSQAEITEAYSAPDQYDEWLTDYEGRRRMWAKRWKVVKENGGAGRLLDVGAGIGTFVAYARDDGWEAEGTEVSESAIAIAAERYGISLVKGQLGDLRFDRKFDVVTLWHVLEHLPSPSAGLELCRRLLRPGGLLVIAVPNDSDSRWRVQQLKSGRYNPYGDLVPGAEIHLSHFTVRVLRRALESKGFRVKRMTVDDHFPVPTWWTDSRVRAYRALMAATGWNLGVATLVLATAT